MEHFADRLAGAVREKGTALCVGLDPRWEALPAAVRNRFGSEGAAVAFEFFCRRVLDLIHDHVRVVKPQSAFFEAIGPAGMSVQAAVLEHARRNGFFTILDAKRGDIASTAAAYADAAFGGTTIDGTLHRVWDADALTVNPYLGRDSVEPFLQVARRDGRGLFVLVRTSNPGAGLFQDLDCGGRKLYEVVADEVVKWSAENVGANGLGDVGAVVGATHPAELKALRKRLPGVWFLVPGYGAQGGTAADVRAALRNDGLGAVVNSSRGITFPFHPDDADWESKIVAATRKAAAELAIT